MRASETASVRRALAKVAGLALLFWLGGCQGDVQCVHDADCPSGFACVADSSGVGHCVSYDYIFAPQDAGADGG